MLPDASVLREKILYSGAHSGDGISADLMPILRAELDIFRNDSDPDVAAFCNKLAGLAEAASKHGTGITFI
jgi:hypothetical protein